MALFWGEQPGRWPIGQRPGTFFTGMISWLEILRPAGDRVAMLAQFFGEVFLHLGGRIKWHRVQMCEQLWQKSQAVLFDGPG